jgi:O-antigen/teichoic acid export membrane protein
VKGFLKDLAATLGTRVLTLVLAFLTNMLVARTLGSSGMGEYTLIMTTLGLMLLVGSVGLENANVYVAGKGRHSLAGLVANSCWVALLGAVLCGVVFWWGRERAFGTILRGVAPFHVVIGLCALPAMLAKVCLQGVQRGRNQLAAWNGTVFAEALLLLAMLLVSLQGFRLGVYGAMVSQLVVAVVIALVVLWTLARASPLAWSIHLEALRECLPYGLKIQVSNLLNFFNYRLSFYLLNLFLSVREVGQYSVALAFLQPVLLISTAIQYVLFPKVSLTDASQAKRWMPKLLRQMVLLMLGMFALLAVASHWLVMWCYGAEYAGSIRPLQVLIVGGVFLSLAAVLDSYNCGRGRPDIPLYSSGVALSLTIILGLWLIPRYGLLGAAWTSVCACAGLVVIEFIGYLRLSGNGVAESLLVRSTDIRDTLETFRELFRGSLRWGAARERKLFGPENTLIP